eukprot:scaffold14579_cov67-Skeletonema_dohrnii-CCMP3373.AAC.1
MAGPTKIKDPINQSMSTRYVFCRILPSSRRREAMSVVLESSRQALSIRHSCSLIGRLFLPIDPVKNAATLCITRPNPDSHPNFTSDVKIINIDDKTTVGIVSSNRIDWYQLDNQQSTM